MSDEYGRAWSEWLLIIGAILVAIGTASNVYFSKRIALSTTERDRQATEALSRNEVEINMLRKQVTDSKTAVGKQQQDSERLRGRLGLGSSIER